MPVDMMPVERPSKKKRRVAEKTQVVDREVETALATQALDGMTIDQ